MNDDETRDVDEAVTTAWECGYQHAITEARERIDALVGQVEWLRQLRERELGYSIALQRIIEGTERGEFSSLIPDGLYHLSKAKRTVARIEYLEGKLRATERLVCATVRFVPEDAL